MLLQKEISFAFGVREKGETLGWYFTWCESECARKKQISIIAAINKTPWIKLKHGSAHINSLISTSLANERETVCSEAKECVWHI